jgi:hypothetical protein
VSLCVFAPLQLRPTKPGDSAATIATIQNSLCLSLKIFLLILKSAVYDDELADGILHFKKRSGNLLNKTILPNTFGI